MKEKIIGRLLKVTLEYTDRIKTLKYPEAQKWIDELNGMVMLGATHGMKISDFKWKEERGMKTYLISKVAEPILYPYQVSISEENSSNSPIYFKTEKEAEDFIKDEKEKEDKV